MGNKTHSLTHSISDDTHFVKQCQMYKPLITKKIAAGHTIDNMKGLTVLWIVDFRIVNK